MVSNDPTNAAEWAELMTRPRTQRWYFSDSEAEEISGVSIGDLRRLQASEAIEAIKAPRVSGGSFRLWSGRDLFLAAIAGAMRNYMKLEIRNCGIVLRTIDGPLLHRIHADSVFDLGISDDDIGSIETEHVFVPTDNPNNEIDYFYLKTERDWYINFHDNMAISISGGSPHVDKIARLTAGHMNVIDDTITDEDEWLRHIVRDCVFSSSLNISMIIRRIYLLRAE
ncbi:hypothetical protein [Azospirillum sp. B2RO_4]|uniref:hypothetical protein n=1 Tax=Azospirillum sp. B2RO_4 TaxID=3027796 RepID=UPI003DA9F459